MVNYLTTTIFSTMNLIFPRNGSIFIFIFNVNLMNRRAIMVGRAVRVKSQLNSHKRFASAFPNYCNLVDNARLYCTNAVCGPPKVYNSVQN